MEQRYLDEFERRVAVNRLPALRRLLARPVHFTSSKVLETVSTRLGKSVRTRGRTFWGATMTLPFPEQLSVFIQRYGFLEEGLTRIFLRCVRPGMTVFDVGAHFGYFSLLASDLVGDSGAVHNFEPTPSTFELLKSNLAARPNCHPQNIALYREETTLKFNDYGLQSAAFNSVRSDRLDELSKAKLAPPKHYEVRATSIDRYVETSGARPDFIKLDAEGAEMDILVGAQRTLAEVRPTLTLEVGDYRADIPISGDTVRHLTEREYVALEQQGTRLVPHEQRDRYQYDNLLFVPAERRGEFIDG